VNRIPHQVLGASVGGTGQLLLAAVTSTSSRWAIPQALAAAAVASQFAGGRFSPDADQYGSWEFWRVPWRWFAKWVSSWRCYARERGRHGDPTQHRGITHWPGVPVLWSLVLAVLELVGAGTGLAPAQTPWWLVWAAIGGWSSHLLGDAIHGRGYRARGPGIPLAPWWNHHGVGLKSDGVTGYVLTLPVAVAGSLLLAGHVIGVI
jgi:hypothetical protein